VPEFAASRTTSTRTLASAPVQESSRSSPSEEAASPVPVAPSAPSPEPTHAGTSTVLFVTVIVIGLLLLFCKFAARIAEFLNRASGQESLSRTANEIIATTRSVQPSEPVETQYATTRVGHPLTVKVDAPLTIGDWPGRNSVVGPERLASPSNRLTMPGVGKSTMGASSNSLPNLPSPTEFQAAFFANAPETLQSIQNDLAQTMGTCDLATQGDLLGSVYVNLHTLNGEADRARLRSIHRLSSALMALVKKLLENSCNITPSALNTASSALEILAVMCADRTCADLSTLVPQILVVDDDAVTRRAISASLQNAFAKPMNADSGEAAVSLADQVRFHLIFMDISMPGMDGFEACSKIHQIPLNRNTPIIFVTSHFDSSSREQAVHAGGCGYLSKPALPAELTLMAITYCFHSRLKGLKMAEQVKAAFA